MAQAGRLRAGDAAVSPQSPRYGRAGRSRSLRRGVGLAGKEEGRAGQDRLRAGAQSGASLARAQPTALSHFLGILPLVFISLRRKLGLKKRRRKERIIIALILQERRRTRAPWKDNLPLFPDTCGVVYFLLLPVAGRALLSTPERGSET